jgi:WD40 repeat protein
VQLWNTATGKKDGEVCCSNGSGMPVSVAFNPDGRTIAVAGTSTVRLWNTATHTALGPSLPIAPGEINEVAYSPDGRTLAVAGFNGIVLWDVRTHSLLGPNLHGGQGTVNQVSFSQDGRTLAAVADNGIFLWDVRTRTLLGRPLAAGDFSVAFSPDEPTFATAGYGPVQLWSGILWTNTAALERQVCGLVWGNVDKAAWSQAAPSIAYERPCPA